MKTFKSFAFAVALAGLTLPMAGCSDDDTAPKGEDVERGDKACRIETFTLNFSDGTTLSGDVYDYDKSVDLSYTTAEFEMMKSATATLTLSEGATVSPDPSQTADYTQPLSFTVTAKDGKTTRTYTTKPVEKVLEGYTKVEAATSKTATEMGIGTAADYKFVGVSGDKLVVGKKVFDYKTFAPAGDLNMTGYEDQKMTGMANDEAGHLIAAVNADGASAVPTTIICWKDGWDKAPSEYIKSETSFIGKQISASGNLLEGAGIVSAMNGTGPKGAHFAWARLDGASHPETPFYGVETNVPSNDGNWSQTISACSGDPLGTWFVFDPERRPDPDDPNKTVGLGRAYTFSNWSAPNKFNMTPIPGAVEDGLEGWGNLTLGSVRAFTFNGTAYGAYISTGWPMTYVSIVDANGEFLLNPNDTATPISHNGSEPIPQITYVYNESEGAGYVFALEAGQFVKSWKLTVVYE